MTEFGVAATLSVDVDDASIDAARAQIEDGLSDVTVSPEIDRTPGGGGAGSALPMADGGGTIGKQLAEQTDLLEDIEDELQTSTRQGAQQGMMSRLQTVLLGRATLGGGGGFPTPGGGGGAQRWAARGAAGTAPFGFLMTQNKYSEGEEPPGIFGEGKSIMDVLGREEAIIDVPAVMGDFADGFRGIEWSGFGADVGDGIESNTDLSIDYSEVPKSITELTPDQRREFSGAPDPKAPTSVTDLTSDQRRAFSGAPGPDDQSGPTELPLQRMKKYAYQKRSDRSPSTSPSTSSSGKENRAANKSTTRRNGDVQVNQNFELDGVSRQELNRELEKAKQDVLRKLEQELTTGSRRP